MEYNPCMHGLMSDMKFYTGTARNYIKAAKAADKPHIKRMFISYAEEALKAAEIKLKEIRRLK